MSRLEELIHQLCPDGVEYKLLGEVCKLSRGKVYSKDYLQNNPGDYPVYSSQTANNGELGRINTYDCEGDFLTWTTDGAHAGTIFHRTGKFSITNVCGLIKIENPRISLRFLYYWLTIKAKEYVNQGMGNPKLMTNQIEVIPVPLPPLPVQEEIVRILDQLTETTQKYQSELEAELELRKKQYEEYRKKILTFDDSRIEVKRYKLGDIGNACMCRRIMKNQTTTKGEIPFYKIGTFGKTADAYISRELYELYKKNYSFPRKGDILLSASGTIGRTVIYNGEDAYYQDSNIVWVDNNEQIILNSYLFYVYKIIEWKTANGGIIERLYNNILLSVQIQVPPIEEQQRIVDILDRMDKVHKELCQSIEEEIKKRKQQYEYYRNQLLDFKKKEV